MTAAIAAALALSAYVASRLAIAIPLVWLAGGLVWLAARFAIFASATQAVVPVVRWRLGSDIASPSLDVAPEDNLAWPVVSLSDGTGLQHEVAAPFGFYLYEFRAAGDVDADLPPALAVRYRVTPLGIVLMPDDRGHVLVGPVLFVAAMLLLAALWAPIVWLAALMK